MTREAFRASLELTNGSQPSICTPDPRTVSADQWSNLSSTDFWIVEPCDATVPPRTGVDEIGPAAPVQLGLPNSDGCVAFPRMNHVRCKRVVWTTPRSVRDSPRRPATPDPEPREDQDFHLRFGQNMIPILKIFPQYGSQNTFSRF